MSRSARPRRILWVDHVHRILGGAEINLVELMGAAESAGAWRSTVACDPDGPLHEALGRTSATRVSYALESSLGTLRTVGTRFPLAGALRAWRSFRTARRALDELVAAVSPEAVVSCTNKDHFAAWPACRRAGIPSVWWVNDIVSADFFPWTARRLFLSQARRGATRLVTVSEFGRRTLVGQGIDPGQVVTVPNGVSPDRYRRGPRGALRRSLQLTDRTPLVGIVGRYTPWKGQDFFLRLARDRCEREGTEHFAVIGHAFNEDQAYEAELRGFVARHGLAKRVRFVPFRNDIAAVLGDLDLLVHASIRPEPFGRILIEAMAVGVPVLAARGGGVPEIVTDERNGLLATPGHPGEYRERMSRLLNDRELCTRLVAEGHRTVVERFSLTRVRTDFEAVLSEAMRSVEPGT